VRSRDRQPGAQPHHARARRKDFLHALPSMLVQSTWRMLQAAFGHLKPDKALDRVAAAPTTTSTRAQIPANSGGWGAFAGRGRNGWRCTGGVCRPLETA
jgi:hypothetical protein